MSPPPVTDSIPDKLYMLPCLGIINGSFCPHYDGEAFRRPSLHKLMSEDKIINGYAADDGAAAHFINGELAISVSSRPHAKVYRVSKKEGEVVEEVVETRYLEQ